MKPSVVVPKNPPFVHSVTDEIHAAMTSAMGCGIDARPEHVSQLFYPSYQKKLDPAIFPDISS